MEVKTNINIKQGKRSKIITASQVKISEKTGLVILYESEASSRRKTTGITQDNKIASTTRWRVINVKYFKGLHNGNVAIQY